MFFANYSVVITHATMELCQNLECHSKAVFFVFFCMEKLKIQDIQRSINSQCYRQQSINLQEVIKPLNCKLT